MEKVKKKQVYEYLNYVTTLTTLLLAFHPFNIELVN